MGWIDGKTAIITGSTRGIGLETARVLLQGNANVTVFCRHKKHGEEARKSLEREGGSLLISIGDVRESSDVDRILKETVEKFGGIDVLMNNAGMAVWKLIEKTSEAEYDAVVGTNLKGAWLFARAVMPVMKKQGEGRIINVSSGLGLSGGEKYSAYSGSKFGMIGFGQSIAREAGAHGVTTVSLALGAVNTKLHLDFHPWEDPNTMMQPDDVARRIFKKTMQAAPPRNGSTIKVYRA